LDSIRLQFSDGFAFWKSMALLGWLIVNDLAGGSLIISGNLMEWIWKPGNASGFFGDECHFPQHGSRIRVCVPPEDIDPIQLLAPTRKSIALFGAVNIRRRRLLTQFE
jgi:hypothetical protein